MKSRTLRLAVRRVLHDAWTAKRIGGARVAQTERPRVGPEVFAIIKRIVDEATRR